VGVEDVNRIPQGPLLKRFPRQFDWLINLNPYAMSRLLLGQTLIKSWTALTSNRRNGKDIDSKEFEDVILSGSFPGAYTSWVYFYHRGRDMIQQMIYQINAFERARFPVYILQGQEDKGQVL
jgi:hypothetical protein